MASIDQLIALADAYKAATGIERDQTVSNRVFGDSKKLTALRKGAGITVDRFNASIAWFRDNWPSGHRFPKSVSLGDHPPAHGPAPQSKQGAAG